MPNISRIEWKNQSAGRKPCKSDAAKSLIAKIKRGREMKMGEWGGATFKAGGKKRGKGERKIKGKKKGEEEEKEGKGRSEEAEGSEHVLMHT